MASSGWCNKQTDHGHLKNWRKPNTSRQSTHQLVATAQQQCNKRQLNVAVRHGWQTLGDDEECSGEAQVAHQRFESEQSGGEYLHDWQNLTVIKRAFPVYELARFPARIGAQVPAALAEPTGFIPTKGRVGAPEFSQDNIVAIRPCLAAKPKGPFRLEFYKFPKELRDMILERTLTHATPVPVDPLWNRRNKHCAPVLDYRILHACQELYADGLHLYYGLNTFSLSLDEFREQPRRMLDWPNMTGQPLAAKFCRSIHVRARGWNNWEDAVRLLRPFKGLQKVVFDMRCTFGIDEGKGGELVWDDWLEVEANEEVLQALADAGIVVGRGGVWIGEESVEVAQRKMRYLADNIRRGKMYAEWFEVGAGPWFFALSRGQMGLK